MPSCHWLKKHHYQTCVFFPYPASTYTIVIDKHTFLFTLVNPSGSEPTKIVPKPGASVGIRCGADLGPRFCENSMNALEVDQKDASPSGFGGCLNLGYGFTCPQNADKEAFFTGKGRFIITQLEVFKIDFNWTDDFNRESPFIQWYSGTSFGTLPLMDTSFKGT